MFGQELRRLRTQKGLTQEELAFKAKLHPVTVSRLETGRLKPTLEVFLRLCIAVEVPAADFAAKLERSFRRQKTTNQK